MPDPILKEADLERIRNGLTSAERAIQMAEMAVQAGLPAEAQLEQAKKTRDQLLRMKQTFFPGQ